MTWWQGWDPTGSKPGDREGRRKEPEEMETGFTVATRDRDETGARTRRLQENLFKRLEVMKKERVKERIYNLIISPN